MANRSLWTAIILVCSASPLIAQQTSTAASASRSAVILDVRDVTTGYSVRADVTFINSSAPGSAAISAQTDRLGHLRTDLPSGRYLMRITSPGYEPMESTWDTASRMKLGIELSRNAPPEELRPEVLNPQYREGYILVHGYVADADTGRPLSNVRVRLDRLGMDTSTNDRGYFRESLQMPPLPPGAGVEDDLSAELPGYKKIILGNQLFSAPDLLLKLELQPGSGVERRDNTHKLLRGVEGTTPLSGANIPSALQAEVSKPVQSAS
jgi:hypothetical protein